MAPRILVVHAFSVFVVEQYKTVITGTEVWRSCYIANKEVSFGASTRRLLPTLERHTNRPYVEKHPLRTTFGGTLQGDETIPRIPIDPVSVCVRNEAATSHIIGDSKCDLEDFGNERVSEAFARKSAVHCKSRH